MTGARYFMKEKERRQRAALRAIREQRAIEAGEVVVPHACTVCHALACVCPDSEAPPPLDLGGES